MSRHTGGMVWGPGAETPGEERLDRSMLSGIAAFRWAALVWLVAVQIASRGKLAHPGADVAGVAVAFAVTVALTWMLRHSPRRLLHPAVVAGELAVGFTLLAADGWVYAEPHSQSLGAAWPLAGVLTAGVAWGWGGGAIAGFVLGLGRVLATRIGDGAPASGLSQVSTCVLYAQVGAVAGYVVQRLRIAETRISAARAREEVARTLHDGVLQTLAVVQRRSTDPSLAELARDQEQELREYLFGLDHAEGDLVARLRTAGAKAAKRDGTAVEVTAVPGPAVTDRAVVDAVVGAVGEAVTNAAKHGGAGRVVVYVEPGDDEVFVSVKDDGTGFDPSATSEGVGLSRSVRGRMAEVGGRVVVDGRPGRGTEVRLWAPLP